MGAGPGPCSSARSSCGRSSDTWPVALANWLFWAYLLEFRGLPVHLFIWIGGIVWFSVNVAVLHALAQGVHQWC